MPQTFQQLNSMELMIFSKNAQGMLELASESTADDEDVPVMVAVLPYYLALDQAKLAAAA